MPQSKGSNFVPAVKFLRVHREEARDRLPEDLHGYLEGRILPGSWYPEEELMSLLRTVASLLPQDEPECWETIGSGAAEFHAQETLEGLVQRGPDELVEALGPVWSLLHDTGSVTVEMRDEGRASVELRDFSPGMPQYASMMRGYMARILELAGADEIEVRIADRSDERARWELAWKS
ncbi:MAG: TIGR02265 family protein [Thermoanaerobaculia bacterium]|nr:TIGR02265 family protein [Thermoanaerobaculia bacterium]